MIPQAGIGIVGSLLVTGTAFSIQAFMGVIVRGGLVVNNAILLMTTTTTLLGMVPMALGIGGGSELQAPLACVIIGGLLSSTLVTLVVMPVV